MTIMTTTMIPCGAKMPIIALVFCALATGNSDDTWWVAPLFYFMGVVAIIISGIMLKKTKLFAGEATPFVMELPEYHMPTVKSVLLSMWERVKGYIIKAGTIIFLSTIVIWFLMNFGDAGDGFGLLDADAPGFSRLLDLTIGRLRQLRLPVWLLRRMSLLPLALSRSFPVTASPTPLCGSALAR